LLPPFVRCGRSVCWIDRGAGASLVHELKYGAWPALAVPMAARMARLQWPDDVVRERTALVAVPLAGARERERGYNQSSRLAHELARHWRVPVWDDVLVRSRATETQTRLTPEARRHNVSGAFRAVAGTRARFRGAHLVLVDDVVTTGATLVECGAALLDGGARIVSFVTFGRAPASGDRR
jgi:ComF family protein